MASSVVFATLALLLAGCFSPPKPPPPPPAVLNYAARQEGVEVVVRTLITWGGAQVWLGDPMWDEYVVTITNRSGNPLQFESVQVIDCLDRTSEGSQDPAVLAARSLENWKAYRKAKLVTYPEYLRDFNGTTLMASAALIAAVPVYAIYVPIGVAANAQRQSTIQREFPERMLDVAKPLAPGESALGSLFVPLSAAPKRLELRLKRGDSPVLLTVPLPDLSRLHLATP
jgi:hypothetical protein